MFLNSISQHHTARLRLSRGLGEKVKGLRASRGGLQISIGSQPDQQLAQKQY